MDIQEIDKYVYSIPENPKCIPDKRGTGYVFFNAMKKHGNKIAQIDDSTGISQTYNELLERSILVAQNMQSRGITPADVVGLCTHNHLDSVVPILASTFLGVTTFTLDPGMSYDEMKLAIELIKPTMMFSVTEGLHSLEKVIEDTGLEIQIVVFGKTSKHTSFSQFILPSALAHEFSPKISSDIKNDVALIIFSSGTTGISKGVCITQYALLYQTTSMQEFADPSTSLYFSAPYWISNILNFIITLLKGSCRIISKMLKLNQIIKLVEKYKVNFMFLSTSQMKILSECLENNYNCDLSSLSCILTGGSSISQEYLKKVQDNLPHTNIINAYGMTENCAIFSLSGSKWIAKKKATVGQPVAGMTYKVVDVNTKEVLGPNMQGELCIRSKCLMKGYINNLKATRDALDSDGFFYTGDLVYYDEDHCFYIIQRIGDIFTFQSYQIIPTILEDVLTSHPFVEEAVILAVPNGVYRNFPIAIVVLKKDAMVSEDGIISYFNERVKEQEKLRVGIKILDAIPKTFSGKVKRAQLKTLLLSIKI